MTNQTRRNIVFTLYIVNDHPRVKPYYVSQTRKIEFNQAFYPINVLRDLGIEAIGTTLQLRVVSKGKEDSVDVCFSVEP